ncbi:MAG: hypothetical protein ACJ788_22665, partial [Ktedonobacteraceae bacterium]
MATCPDLATQLSELQSHLARLQEAIDNPRKTCLDVGIDPDNGDCILYIRNLTTQAEDDEK